MLQKLGEREQVALSEANCWKSYRGVSEEAYQVRGSQTLSRSQFNGCKEVRDNTW